MDQPILFEKPRGVRDILPPLAARKREIEKKIAVVLRDWGYEEIVTPTFEYAETFANGAYREEEDNLFTFIERSGRAVVLRPDMTAPIARVLASSLQDRRMPVRLSYNASIFRQHGLEAGRAVEFTQSGVELMGDQTPDADAEVIALLITALEAAGVQGYCLAIGQVQFLHALLKEHIEQEGVREKLACALLAKDFVAYDQLVAAEVEAEASRAILREVPQLRGGIEVLARAAKLTASAEALAALDNLRTIWDVLVLHNVESCLQLDLSLLLTKRYYTGAIFEGYAPQVGFPICSGGRYDQLVAKFGRSVPATGFVIGIERVLEMLEKALPKDPKERYLLLYAEEDRYPVIGFASFLRAKHFIITAQRVEDVERAMQERVDEHVTLVPFRKGKLLTSTKLLRAMYSDFCHLFSQ